MKMMKKTNNTKAKKPKKEVKKGLTKKDAQRWSAYIGATCLIVAVIVSVASSILWIIGVSALLLAFSDRLKLPKKKCCTRCGK
ncbi:hypothetical protein GOV11_00820 [Candidatus Woesearchaeota archaeon]|nr:hypothetical protein [Candidatus Woesearchaeota archaeon]